MLSVFVCTFFFLQDTDQKIESVQLEFTYLLTTQLESQRKYFETQMKHFEESTFVEVNYSYFI